MSGSIQFAITRSLTNFFTKAKVPGQTGFAASKEAFRSVDSFQSTRGLLQSSSSVAASGLSPTRASLFQQLVAPLSKPWVALQQTPAVRNFLAQVTTHRLALQPTVKLTNIQALRGAVERSGARAVMLDMDDTIRRIGAKGLDKEMVATLRYWEKNNIKIGLVSNNPFQARVQSTKDLFDQAGLKNIEVIYDAGKPSKIGFERMLALMNQGAKPGSEIKPFQAVMVGDGRINDIYGANRAGLYTIQANWFGNTPWQNARAISFDMLSHTFNPLYRLYNGTAQAQRLASNPSPMAPNPNAFAY